MQDLPLMFVYTGLQTLKLNSPFNITYKMLEIVQLFSCKTLIVIFRTTFRAVVKIVIGEIFEDMGSY